ncbi:MAG: hypothetical protein CME71_10845 [Halobacteriovorax sp.]|nr:hypothetical protein [Halobacteriovorax sp.]
MSSSFQKKTTNVFLTLFIGFIVISFMFTGYETMKGQPDTVASVGDQNISFREYQSEFNRQIEFYSQFVLGGQTLSAKQIKDFNIKQNALKSLVNNRLSFVLGERLGVVVASEEIKESIKNQENFQTNGKFDIERYKAILRANQFAPLDYEKMVEREMITSKTSTVLGKFPVSKAFLSDIQSFKNQKRTATIIRLSKQDVASMLEISKAEIDQYLSQEENLERVKSLFNDRKASLDQAEEVEARHILVRSKEGEKEADLKKRIEDIAKKTTAKNFAEMAKKFTEEPGGKDKGGSLGSFGRGRMVPEFEKAAFELPVGKVSAPVKTDFGFHIILVEGKKEKKEAVFEQHQVALASELLRKTKTEQATQLVSQIADEAQAALVKGSKSALASIQKKWKANLETDIEINRYDGSKGQIFLETTQLNKVFSHETTGVDRFETAAYITLVKSEPSKVKDSKPEAEDKSTAIAYSNKMRQEMTTKLGESVNVRVYENRIP